MSYCFVHTCCIIRQNATRTSIVVEFDRYAVRNPQQYSFLCRTRWRLRVDVSAEEYLTTSFPGVQIVSSNSCFFGEPLQRWSLLFLFFSITKTVSSTHFFILPDICLCSFSPYSFPPSFLRSFLVRSRFFRSFLHLFVPIFLFGHTTISSLYFPRPIWQSRNYYVRRG